MCRQAGRRQAGPLAGWPAGKWLLQIGRSAATCRAEHSYTFVPIYYEAALWTHSPLCQALLQHNWMAINSHLASVQHFGKSIALPIGVPFPHQQVIHILQAMHVGGAPQMNEGPSPLAAKGSNSSIAGTSQVAQDARWPDPVMLSATTSTSHPCTNQPPQPPTQPAASRPASNQVTYTQGLCILELWPLQAPGHHNTANLPHRGICQAANIAQGVLVEHCMFEGTKQISRPVMTN